MDSVESASLARYGRQLPGHWIPTPLSTSRDGNMYYEESCDPFADTIPWSSPTLLAAE